MIGIKRIEFEQVEGDVADCHAHAFFSWRDINKHVVQAARKAPADGSYYKCDVVVEWQDGSRRYLRFDMQRAHAAEQTPISDEFRRDVFFYSGRWHPEHISDEQYKTYLGNFDDDVLDRAKQVIDGGYDLGIA